MNFYEELRDRLEADADLIGLHDASGERKSDEEIYQSVNEVTELLRRPRAVPTGELLGFVATSGMYYPLKLARTDPNLTPQQRAAADTLFDFLAFRVESVHLENILPIVQSLVPSVFTEEQYRNLENLGYEPTSWAQYNYERDLTLDDIRRSH